MNSKFAAALLLWGIFRIHPVRPIEEVRKQAIAATPPVESGPFRKPDLVDLTSLSPAIHLDIRYATSANFMGAPMYSSAQAFLERPAAEALLRAEHTVERLGFGLLIHDGYRPWYVTRMFWDATPPAQHSFVANPAQGSRHNRGCAVDLSMYDLKTGRAVSMPSGYDEMSGRAAPDYPGGSRQERSHRRTLRDAMEAQGFQVFKTEWWHFDYKDWREYPILNVPFEKLNAAAFH